MESRFVEIHSSVRTCVEYLHTRIKDFSLDAATPSSEISPGSIPGFEADEIPTTPSQISPGKTVVVTITLNGVYL